MDFFQLLREWLQTVTVVQGPFLLKTIGILTTLVAITQGVKKGAESLYKAGWLLKLIPGASGLVESVTSGYGPRILNALITFGTLGLVVAQDGTLTGGEAMDVVTAILAGLGIVIGNEGLYRILRNWLFPKGEATEVKIKVTGQGGDGLPTVWPVEPIKQQRIPLAPVKGIGS
jgi:hypothetical protein